MARLTLPQQRAIETRERIIDAAGRVFARRGYGQATVQDIADEAGISMGALYHHFKSKEELFRALVEDHVRRDVMEYEPRPAASVREAIEHFVDHQIEHLRESDLHARLNVELWAQAAREDWAREAVANTFGTFRGLISRLIVIAQEAGVARRDIDIEATSALMEALFLGTALQWSIDAEHIDLDALSATWADLIERFIRTDSGGDVDALEDGVTRLLEDLREEQA